MCLIICSFLLFSFSVREGRNERQIDRPKDVLVSMRKDQQYRETKMLLLQKLWGIEMLEEQFNLMDEDVEDVAPRKWFNGVHRYESKEKVISDFLAGTPISCFQSKSSSEDTFHVPFYGDDWSIIKYLTLKSHTSDMFIEETGIHFCQFRIEKEAGSNNAAVTTISKKDLADIMGDYAFILPYKKNNYQFQCQYTACYWDWHVLRCNSLVSCKGLPAASADVFSTELIADICRSQE